MSLIRPPDPRSSRAKSPDKLNDMTRYEKNDASDMTKTSVATLPFSFPQCLPPVNGNREMMSSNQLVIKCVVVINRRGSAMRTSNGR